MNRCGFCLVGICCHSKLPKLLPYAFNPLWLFLQLSCDCYFRCCCCPDNVASISVEERSHPAKIILAILFCCCCCCCYCFCCCCCSPDKIASISVEERSHPAKRILSPSDLQSPRVQLGQLFHRRLNTHLTFHHNTGHLFNGFFCLVVFKAVQCLQFL